jgi:hypothetical protein
MILNEYDSDQAKEHLIYIILVLLRLAEVVTLRMGRCMAQASETRTIPLICR